MDEALQLLLNYVRMVWRFRWLALVVAFSRATGLETRPVATSAHLWRYARSAKPQEIGCLYEPGAAVVRVGPTLD